MIKVLTVEYVLNSQSLLQTILLLYNYRVYKKSRGWNEDSFTYWGLRNYLYYKYRKKIEWHTVERTIRKLVEEGYLERREYKKRRIVVFYWTDRLKTLATNVVITIEMIKR